METKIAIVQFLFANKWKILTDSLGANPALTSHEFQTASDVMKFCSTEQNCLVIANVNSKEDLIQLATFVKSSRRVLKNTVIKIVVMNATENKQFEKAISKLGSIEILEPTVSVKALRFKMDFWMKAMRGQAKKLGALNQKSLEATANEAATEVKSLIQSPALDCENDIWLLTRDSDCKRIIGRWMVKFMGPSPYVGAWTEVPNKQDIWTFQFKKAFVDTFQNGQGNWVFKGEQKPEFNWQENRWMFTGDDFELFFYDGNVSQSRVKLAAKVLTIAENSAFAKTKESLITDTFNKDLTFRQEAESLKGNTLDFENEGDLGGNLEGKIKDKPQSGKNQLEGKLKAQKEAASNLHGKVKDKEASIKGYLEGEVSEQEEKKNGQLHGKVKDKEELSGNLEGKVKDKEESLEGHLEGEVNEKESAARDLAGKIKDKEASLEDLLDGELKSRESAKENLKGILKQSEVPQASKKKGKAGEVESIIPLERGDHKQHNEKLAATWGGEVKEYTADGKLKAPELKGKNDKTEHLEAHWGGKNSSSELNTKDLSAPGSTGLKEGSLLDLKKTEHEHQTHYKNHNEAAQFEAGELGKHQYKDGEEGSLGGKTSTDKLASHYGTGKKSESPEAPGKSPLSGHAETDRLAAHLGRKNTERHAETTEDEADAPSALSGKTKTEKIKGHYGSGKKAAPHPQSEVDSIKLDIDEVMNELEASAENVLPFVKPEEERALEKLTENAAMHTFVIQNGRKFECKLDDFFENTVIFVSKIGGLRSSEKAMLDINLNYQGENARINCEAVIQSLDDDGSGGVFVTVEVNTTDAKNFDAFMDLLKSRQENIQSFMMKAKGF